MLTRTYLPPKDGIVRKWHLIDGNGLVLGRLSTRCAGLLSGKTKAIYTPHLDTGDHVVVINASKIILTGNKLKQKIDYRHSGYPGGDRYTIYEKLMKDTPEKAVQLAVKGMLPKTRLGAKMLRRLIVYKGEAHLQGAQFAVPKAKEIKAETK